MAKTLVIMIGVQGSGKTTFFHEFLEGKFVRVNLDTLKTRRQEQLLVEKCLQEGLDFAVENTNPTRQDRARYIPLAKEKGYRVIGYYMQSILHVCLERNAKREGSARIVDKAVVSTYKKLELPSVDEGFDELYFVRNDGVTMSIEPWNPEA